MPSDDRAKEVFAALAPARTAFRSAVTAAAEELRSMLEQHAVPRNGRAERIGAELGAFAAGRIDEERFAALLADGDVFDDAALARLERSRVVLASLVQAGEAPYAIEVPAGGDLVAEVGSALALTGRAFGAARVAELIRTGRSAQAVQEDAAGAFPFERWTRGERRMAPPLLVEADGGDIEVGGLSAFLDGTQKIAIIVRGESPPAPLVRLLTPRVFVLQTTDPADFGRLAAFEGPAVGALVPGTAARFIHDPAAGASLPSRLRVDAWPDEPPRRPIGRASVFLQDEELAQLRSLDGLRSAAAGASPVPAAGGGGVEGAGAGAGPEPAAAPADRLAAWLLRQAELGDL